MADNKKYYYLKLKDNFFDMEEMKLLESHPQGDKYQNIYLKLCLLSLKNEGRLIFRDGIPYDLNMLAVITRKDIGVVKDCIQVLKSFGLIDILETGDIYMTDIQKLIGHGSTEAERISNYRKRIQEKKDVTMLQNCTPENRDKRLEIRDKRLEIRVVDIEKIYSAYPSKCPIEGRPTGKSTNDKKKILQILKTIEPDDLLERIQLYINQCVNTKTYIKNFSTFLNNIPDREALLAQTTKQRDAPSEYKSNCKDWPDIIKRLEAGQVTENMVIGWFRNGVISESDNSYLLKRLRGEL